MLEETLKRVQYPQLRTGKCPTCKTVYRWQEVRGSLLAEARCVDCDKALKRTRVHASTPVMEVEADWILGRSPDGLNIRPECAEE
jgi:phage FluMu protein Com